MIRLRSVEANNDKLIIKNLNGQETIEYSDIEYFSQMAMIRPTLISLKYNDKRTGDSRNILIMPDTSSQIFKFNFLEEHGMTKFVRDQIIKSNPNYNTDIEPSKWLPFGLIVLTGVPVMIMVQIFFMHFDKY